MWSRDGRQILFSSGLSNQMSVAPIVTEPSVSIGKLTVFSRPSLDLGPNTARPFDIAPDGKVVGIANVTSSGNRDGTLTQTSELRVIVNWLEELKQRAR
jgi:hypothetical protein